MKLVSILFFILISISSCVSDKEGQGNENKDKQPEVSSQFLIINNIEHFDNNSLEKYDVSFNFNQQEANALKEATVKIIPNIIKGKDKIKLYPAELNLPLKDLKGFTLTPIGASQGGEIEIQFTVNGVLQKSELNTILSHRKIMSLDLNPIYKKNDPVDTILQVSSDFPDDNFMVSFTGTCVENLTPSCSLSDFTNGVSTACKVHFNIKQLAPIITAIIEDEKRSTYSANVHVCDANKETLFIEKSAYDIAFGSDMSVKIFRCSNNISQSLEGTLAFVPSTASYLTKSRAHENKIVKTANNISDKSIADIIGIDGSLDNTFNFEPGKEETTIKIVNKSKEKDDFRFILPATFNMEISAKDYVKAIATITNRSTEDPVIELDGDFDLNQHSVQTVDIKRTNINSNTAINFCLAKTESSTKCDDNLAQQYSITEDIDSKKLTIDLIKNKETLPGGVYYMLASLDTAKKQTVTFAGEHTNRKVVVHSVTSLNFLMEPSLKHVLTSFPSFYYLGISNNSQQQSAAIGDQLYLYYINSAAAPATNCDSIKFEKVDNSNPSKPGVVCTLGTQNALGTCACPLTDGKLNETCVFKMTMPTNYNDGDLCQLSVRTANNFNEGSATTQATKGLTEINLTVTGSAFSSAQYIEMYNDKTDNTGNLLNTNWVTPITADNIKDRTIFNDGLIFEMKREYFFADTANNRFVIKNYPGRNLVLTGNDTINLPTLELIIGYNVKGLMSWGIDRCDAIGVMPANLGCTHGSKNKPEYDGPATIPPITVGNNGIISVNGELNVASGWINQSYYIHLLDSKKLNQQNSNTINLNMPTNALNLPTNVQYISH